MTGILLLLSIFAAMGILAVGYLLGNMFPMAERKKIVERVELVPRHIANAPPRNPNVLDA